MSFENHVNPQNPEKKGSALASFRIWLMDGNDPNTTLEGKPVWAWLVENEWFEAVGEAWAAGANPNTRDETGRGWAHWAISHQVPSWLALEGLRRLNETWWEPDNFGHTPFHLPVYDQRLAQAMVVRWWTEQRRWKLLERPFDPMASQLPQAAAWATWKGIVRP